jgi:hypothetical protein
MTLILAVLGAGLALPLSLAHAQDVVEVWRATSKVLCSTLVMWTFGMGFLQRGS